MTFLVDEREIEITELRSSLQEKEIKQQEMAEALWQKEEKLDELEIELEHANKNFLEARTGQEEAEAKIEELKLVIKQRELEIISMNETIDSEKAESKIQSQELSSKTQRLENELQDMEHKLLEVESELEFTKNSCEKVTADKQELVEILGAYGEAFNDSSSVADVDVDIESLKAQLGTHLGKISSLLKTTNDIEKINNKLNEALEGRRMLEEKLGELQTSFQGQKSALEEEIDELRESVLNEKKLVFELEDKVNFAENGKSAMEAELRRVLQEKETSLAKDDVDELVGAKEKVVQLEYEIQRLTEDKHQWESLVHSETELRHKLETQKEMKVQFEDETRRLKEEIDKLESLAKTKSVALEEERKSWEEQMAGITQRYEEERQQLMEQLREISTLKVKESEDIYSEKEEKIVELESKLANVTKTTADYERALEHYQLKLAKIEHERDTILERLEKQVFPVPNFVIVPGSFYCFEESTEKINLPLYFTRQTYVGKLVLVNVHVVGRYERWENLIGFCSVLSKNDLQTFVCRVKTLMLGLPCFFFNVGQSCFTRQNAPLFLELTTLSSGFHALVQWFPHLAILKVKKALDTSLNSQSCHMCSLHA